MSYQTLFSLDIFHNYYQSHICSDFSLEPTFDCTNLINGHRLILKKKTNGIQIIARFDAKQKPWIDLAEDLKFTFILKLRNTNFVDFTDIIEQTNKDLVYLFSNQNIAAKETSELERKTERISNIPWIQRTNIWGIIEIYNNISLAQNRNYKITFQSKKKHWKYYLVTNKKKQSEEFEISDQEQTRSPKISFTPKEIDEQDPVVVKISKQFPTSQQYLFRSATEIDVQEVPLRNIQLLKKELKIMPKKEKNKSSKTVWIEHLPNPPNNSDAKIINLLNKV